MLVLLGHWSRYSILLGKGWLSSWLTRWPVPACNRGQCPQLVKSSQILTWSDEKGAQGNFCLYGTFPLPFSLWGEIYYLRWECFISNQMKRLLIKCCKWGYNPDKGLGKDQQKIVPPLKVVPNKNTEGLGYSNSISRRLLLLLLARLPGNLMSLYGWSKWPLMAEKLQAVEYLVMEKLTASHIEPSIACNIPILLLMGKNGDCYRIWGL